MVLTDLVSGLKTAQLDFHDTTQNPLIFYRGQTATTEELLKFNLLLVIQSFAINFSQLL